MINDIELRGCVAGNGTSCDRGIFVQWKGRDNQEWGCVVKLEITRLKKGTKVRRDYQQGESAKEYKSKWLKGN